LSLLNYSIITGSQSQRRNRKPRTLRLSEWWQPVIWRRG